MIKKGDTVLIVRYPCCGAGLGMIGEASSVDFQDDRRCKCGVNMGAGRFTKVRYSDGPGTVPTSWLKKLDPPNQGETREAYVNLKQPRKVTA